MNLDPLLSKFDRIVNLLGGVGIVAYASLGDFDHAWVRMSLAVLGVVFVVGGIGGT